MTFYLLDVAKFPAKCFGFSSVKLFSGLVREENDFKIIYLFFLKF